MATILLRVFFIAGFCLATVGAAGFSSPREPEAAGFLIAGLVMVALTGWLQRRARRQERLASGNALSQAQLLTSVRAVLAATQRLEAEAPQLDARAFADRMEQITGLCTEIGSRNEDYLRALGLAEYTRIWDGFANGERLLNRAWSMSTDGFKADAEKELPRARVQFERSAAP